MVVLGGTIRFFHRYIQLFLRIRQVHRSRVVLGGTIRFFDRYIQLFLRIRQVHRSRRLTYPRLHRRNLFPNQTKLRQLG